MHPLPLGGPTLVAHPCPPRILGNKPGVPVAIPRYLPQSVALPLSYLLSSSSPPPFSLFPLSPPYQTVATSPLLHTFVVATTRKTARVASHTSLNNLEVPQPRFLD